MISDIALTVAMLAIVFTSLVFMASIAIPVYGYSRKRWKGLALGCLIQPIVCFIVLNIVFGIYVAYKAHSIHQQRKSAMVTIKTIEQGKEGTDTLTWYLQDNDECMMNRKLASTADASDSDSSDDDISRHDLYDVILLDSIKTSVCVEDRIIVRFDLKNQKATATDYDMPAEVVKVNWDKVRGYFEKRKSAL